MLASPQATNSILLYAPDLDSGLRQSIESIFPEANVRCAHFELDDWLHHIGGAGTADGVLIDTDAMGLGDLRTVGASLKLHPNTWCLMLVGDRGIAGFENLLTLSNISILPKPYTPQGLRTCLKQFSDSGSKISASSSDNSFLSGLVEGLRDPLTCISGGLQMVRMGGEDALEFVEPALRASLQVSEQLEYIELATTEMTPHFDSFDIRDCALGVEKDLLKLGFNPKINVEAGAVIYAEPRCTRAALKASFLLLQRFGLSSEITLVSDHTDDGHSLIWQQHSSAELAADTLAPPPYLEELIRRLADKAQANPHFEKLKEIVPISVGLLFKS